MNSTSTEFHLKGEENETLCYGPRNHLGAIEGIPFSSSDYKLIELISLHRNSFKSPPSQRNVCEIK